MAGAGHTVAGHTVAGAGHAMAGVRHIGAGHAGPGVPAGLRAEKIAFTDMPYCPRQYVTAVSSLAGCTLSNIIC